MSEHTPTPWSFNGNAVRAETGERLYVCSCSSTPDGERDAEFIVRACNAYDELVAALEEIQQYASEALGGRWDLAGAAEHAGETAAAAIKKATA